MAYMVIARVYIVIGSDSYLWAWMKSQKQAEWKYIAQDAMNPTLPIVSRVIMVRVVETLT